MQKEIFIEREIEGMKIEKSSLDMIEHIGSGTVAEVWLANFTVDPIFELNAKQVAVKMLKGMNKNLIHQGFSRLCKTH